MQILQVQMLATEFSMSPWLRDYLERSLRSAFAPARSRIERIVVQLRDLNGPRGGRDKLCQICVTMPGEPGIVVKAVQENMVGAIDWAIKRAAHRAIRILMRRRDVSRATTGADAGPDADEQNQANSAHLERRRTRPATPR